MKKLLILVLVLGLCSAANAALTAIEIDADGSHAGATITVVTGATVSVEMYSGNTDTGLAYLGFEDNALYTLANETVTTNAGDQGAYYPLATYGGYQYYTLVVSRTATAPPIVAGTMFLVDFTAGSSTGTVDVYLMDEFSSTQDTTVINIVPEPMTIALLGLGGLFLRRRR